jgi:hypothetical protein
VVTAKIRNSTRNEISFINIKANSIIIAKRAKKSITNR